MMKLFTILIFLSINSITAYSQNSQEIHKFENLYSKKEQKQDWSFAKRNSTNEIQQLAVGLFLFYKTFISSQDKAKCSFYPSCSVYAMQSIQQKGFIIGTFAATDRLSRCNGTKSKLYKQYKNTGLRYDPVTSNKH